MLVGVGTGGRALSGGWCLIRSILAALAGADWRWLLFSRDWAVVESLQAYMGIFLCSLTIPLCGSTVPLLLLVLSNLERCIFPPISRISFLRLPSPSEQCLVLIPLLRCAACQAAAAILSVAVCVACWLMAAVSGWLVVAVCVLVLCCGELEITCV